MIDDDEGQGCPAQDLGNEATFPRKFLRNATAMRGLPSYAALWDGL